MDPFTLIAAATAITKALGLDQKLGKMIAGDRGAEVAGKVVKVAQAVTGAPNPDAALAAISGDLGKWHELQTKMIELEAQELGRILDDIASARGMQEKALEQDDKFSKRFVYYFATAWSTFAMGYLVFITFGTIPEANQRFADTILGFLLGTIIATIIVYFYGSSRSSHGKDNSIGALVDAVRERAKK